MKKTALVLFALVLSSPAYGLVYTWTDSSGITHFTNKEYEIPARYRTKTKSLYPEQGDTGASQQNTQTPQANPEAQPQAVVQQAGHEEPIRNTPSVIAPVPQQSLPERATRKRRVNRATTEE